MRIVISSGHGKHISGAASIINEVVEARKVVSCVVVYLKKIGVEVIEYHDDVSTNQTDNINNIVKYHNSQTRDIDVSIHFNAFIKTYEARGVEVLYLTDTEAYIANKVSAAISSASGLKNRGAKKRIDLGFLLKTTKPSILVEICFVDSTTDVNIYHNKFEDICKAIAESITEKTVPDDKVIYILSEKNISSMQDLGVISSPDYWRNVTSIEYLDDLLYNASKPSICDKRINNGISDLDTALDVLVFAGVITTREYWHNLANGNIQYIDRLLINIANKCRIVLEKIVQAEAGIEGVYGQELVANVINNRSNYKSFPNGIYNVVFQSKLKADGDISYEFYPIINGAYKKAIPSESVKIAIDNVLNGKDNSQGALYFCTVDSAKRPNNWHENNLRFLFEYKNHKFYK